MQTSAKFQTKQHRHILMRYLTFLVDFTTLRTYVPTTQDSTCIRQISPSMFSYVHAYLFALDKILHIIHRSLFLRLTVRQWQFTRSNGREHTPISIGTAMCDVPPPVVKGNKSRKIRNNRGSGRRFITFSPSLHPRCTPHRGAHFYDRGENSLLAHMMGLLARGTVT